VDDGAAAVRGGISLTIAQVATRAIQVGFVALATRSVSESDFGRFSLASGLLVLGSLIADLGTGPALIRLSSRRPDRATDLLGGSVLASFGLGVLGWAATVGVAAAIYSRTQSLDVAVMSASLPFLGINTSLYAALDATGRIPTRAAVSLLQPLVAAGAAGVAVLVTGDIRAALWCAPIAAALCTAAGLFALQRAGLLPHRVRPSAPVLREVFRLALPFALFSGLGSLSARFDLLLLGAHDGAAPAASYDLALRTCETLGYLQSIVTAPTVVLLNRRIAAANLPAARRAYDLAVRLSFVTGGVAAVSVVALAGSIVGLLGGGGYHDSATALAISGTAIWLAFPALVQGSLIMAGNHLRAGLATATALTAITLALDVILIVRFGVRGAAAAAALGVAVTFLGGDLLHRRTLGWPTWLPPAPLWAALAVAFAIGGVLRDRPLVGAPLALLVYGVGVMITGTLGRDEIRRILDGLRRSAAAPGSTGP
jgi:O-antigen/teichoic acid export membrane protein